MALGRINVIFNGNEKSTITLNEDVKKNFKNLPLGRKVDEFVRGILYFHRYDELVFGFFFDGDYTITRSSELVSLHSVDVDVVTDVICRLELV